MSSPKNGRIPCEWNFIDLSRAGSFPIVIDGKWNLTKKKDGK